jgi:predicted DsbA family dithiol-disulfide isomerase
MTKPIQIDFVSDIVCPWCAIGLGELEKALANLTDVVEPHIELQPFELNPTMPPEGQGMAEHIEQKFGRKLDDAGGMRDMIRARAAEVGVTMAMREDSRIYNSFDAHRLLHWAGLEGKQVALKHALFTAYFTDGANIASADVLVGLAEGAGLDPVQARDVLESGRYTDEVRAAEQTWQRAGISSVPAIVINRKYLISGGQPAAVFEESLRKIAAEAA